MISYLVDFIIFSMGYSLKIGSLFQSTIGSGIIFDVNGHSAASSHLYISSMSECVPPRIPHHAMINQEPSASSDTYYCSAEV